MESYDTKRPARKGWWKSAVFYQIYPKSFQDSNGDGIGDLNGIITRLDYLQSLGADGIWLCPVFCSPQADNGYDVSDYRAIDPMFGSMEDMERLIQEAGKRNLSIILDLVFNHTSREHFWFQEAVKSRDNPYHEYYIWRDGKEGTPPNDCEAIFGGSAWEYVPSLGQYYFHQFAREQPDLNWSNPAVREQLYDIIRYWKNKGVDGFRLDALDVIGKDVDRQIIARGPNLHRYIQEMSSEVFSDGTLAVGEAWSADVPEAREYTNSDGSELSMIFQFEQNFVDQGETKWEKKPLDLVRLKKILASWQTGLHGTGWNSLFLENHDLPRIVSRWGNDGPFWNQSARMLAILQMGMEGTPYIFQGQELGMTNCRFCLEECRDVEIHNFYKAGLAAGKDPAELMEAVWFIGRDNGRTPMQWDASKNAGFTEGTPWICVNPNYPSINAHAQMDDPDSVFSCYRDLIRIRKSHPVLLNGDFELLEPDNETVFAYLRRLGDQEVLVVCSFSAQNEAFELPDGFEDAQTLISNYRGRSQTLRPYEAFMLLRTGAEKQPKKEPAEPEIIKDRKAD